MKLFMIGLVALNLSLLAVNFFLLVAVPGHMGTNLIGVGAASLGAFALSVSLREL